MKKSVRLAISCGDPQGIGPEITVKSVREFAKLDPWLEFVLAGPERLLRDAFGGAPPANATIDDVPFSGRMPPPSLEGGTCALASLDHALNALKTGRADALVTAPLSKSAVARRLPGFTGHTDYLGGRAGVKPLMMLASPKLRVFLATVHVPLARVAELMTRDRVTAAAEAARQGLADFFGIARPRLALLALNPHAGEEGELGREEIDVLAPAIEGLGGSAAGYFGPFSADTFFTPGRYDRYDGVLAMYHDQGLVALKSLSFGEAVNVSIGLPYVRTSPDHGTAFDIAGLNQADPASMKLAILWARDAVLRKRH